MSGKGVSNIHPKQNRRDQMVMENVHDPYQARLKLKAPTVCSSCDAVYQKGRWTWESKPKQADSVRCPACQRAQDRVPAGFLTIQPEYFSTRKDEIMSLIMHTEEREKKAHPMKRIMQIDDQSNGMEITFTDPGLARNIGDAVKNAYGGTLDYKYTQGEFMLRVKLEK